VATGELEVLSSRRIDLRKLLAVRVPVARLAAAQAALEDEAAKTGEEE